MGEKRNALRILVGKPEGRRPLGRPRRRWMEILKWISEKLDGMRWIDLGHNRYRRTAIVNTIMKLYVP
jgi:hypothetical protein